MQLSNATADILVPDGLPLDEALARITHLGIGAHQDDLEFMAFHGILACLESATNWFGGVTCTDGRGSPRTGAYAACSDEEMQAVRREEQRRAAGIGHYGVMLQLDYPSRAVKRPGSSTLVDDLRTILQRTRPVIVYTHNPADKHDTHIGVAAAVIRAVRSLPDDERPDTVWGCEVWRDLDWLPDEHKVLMDVSGRIDLAAALNGVFESQIAGGKRYDLAVQGRRLANATFLQSHEADQASRLALAMDLTPLTRDPEKDIVDYVCGFIDEFKTDVQDRLRQALDH